MAVLGALLLAGAAFAQAAGGDLKLEDALLQLSQAPSVTQSRLSVTAAQANLDAARTALGLTVSVTGNGAYSGSYTTKVPATGKDATVPSALGGAAGVNVSLGILPWSTNQYTLRSAQRNLSLAEAYLASISHTVGEYSRGIGIPTLMVGGQQDELGSPATQEALRATFADARLLMLPDVGHLIHYEKAPQAAAAVRRFLEGLGG